MMDDNDLDSFSMNSSSSACTEMGSEVIRYPGQHDVLFGRGGAINQHVGNIKFRKIVNEQKEDYFRGKKAKEDDAYVIPSTYNTFSTRHVLYVKHPSSSPVAPKCEKPKIAHRVVAIVRNLQPPGRFLAPLHEADRNCKDVDGKILWTDVGDKKARAKASQCLRERKIDPPSDTSSSKKSSGVKKRKKVHRQVNQRNYSSVSNRNNVPRSIQTNPVPSRQDHHVSSTPGPAVCSHRPTDSPNVLNGGYYHSAWWHYRHYDNMGPLDHGQRHRVVQAVTPCYDESNNKRPKVCLSSTSRPINDVVFDDQQRSHRKVDPENDHSWIGSFCSVETKLIEEGEKASLPSQVTQMPLIIPSSDDHTLPVVLSATSWEGSDVGSELTDNSHVKSFE